MDNIFEELLEDATMTLTFDDDEELECTVLGIFEADNGQKYIALVSDEEDEEEENEVFLYRFSMSEDGEPVLENIEDEDELEEAVAAFEEIVEFEDDDEE